MYQNVKHTKHYQMVTGNHENVAIFLRRSKEDSYDFNNDPLPCLPLCNTLSRKFGTSPIKQLITIQNRSNLSKIWLECKNIVRAKKQQ